ncbi:hypothetical protein ES703_101918 [subsurface metagenome]
MKKEFNCEHEWFNLGPRWISNKDSKTAIYCVVDVCKKCHKERLGDPYEQKVRKKPEWKSKK